MKNSFLIIAAVLIISCQPNKEEILTQINQFDDPVLVEIEELQDKRDSEKLLPFLANENAIYRAAAAEAFASIQDTLIIDQLSQLLDDENAEVRKSTAYALGQMYHEDPLIKLKMQLDNENSVAVRKVIWEAMGKCVSQEKLNYFTTVVIEDPIELEGYAWGIYRAGIRGVTNDTLIYKAVNLLYPNNTFESRFAAAHFLARARDIQISDYLDSLIGSVMYDKSSFVRMASVSALRNDTSAKSIDVVRTTLLRDHDYRVRINALRTMRQYDFATIQEDVFNALYDDNVNVAITAAAILITKANDSIGKKLLEAADSVSNWRVKAQLMGAVLKINPTDELLVEKIKSNFERSGNSYEKAELLTSLSHSYLAYEFIVTQTLSSTNKVVSTSGISALASLRSKSEFPNELIDPMADVFKQAIITGDLAMIGTATSVISNAEYNFKELYDTIDFLYEAKEKLTLPKDNEGMQSLQAAIDFFEDNETTTSVTNEYNHPINWETVHSIPTNKKIQINTKKGAIIISLFVNKAPGTVANFVELLSKGYYNDKNFHRVVANFVAQGGCNRGDGWGGESYSIRSEFAPLKYAEGYIGMASAGKDTEGTQWFITHSPTPHLDGRYTIFAKVDEGMDVVHNLEVGDKIISMEEL